MIYNSHKKINELEAKTSLFNTDVLVFADIADNGRAKQITFQDFLTTIQNNTSLNNLNDVNINTPLSGQGLIFDGITWTNQDISLTPAGINQQLQYNDNGAFAGANVYYDKTNQRLGVGTTTPTRVFEVNGDASFRQPIAQKTANYSILTSDSNTLFHNNTATVAITLTLPAVQDGLTYEFLIKSAQTLTITGVATIRYGSITGTNLSAIDIGNHVKLVGVAGEWVVTQITGQWDLI